jgi:O-antigen/teichoic acid export membrane protein
LSFGGWLTVTNIVGPLMTYMDRFFIGAMLGLSAVTYYVTPYEVLSRLQMLPQAIMGVLFPAMAAAHGGDQQRLDRALRKQQ